MRASVAVALAVTLTVGGGACGSRASSVRAVARNDAVVLFSATEPAHRDAAVWVNGRYIGLVADLPDGIALSPGTHRVELRHDAHHTRYLELTVEARERRDLAIDLALILP